AGSQLAQASSKVQVQQAQANAPAANPQAATAQAVQAQATAQNTAVAKANPSEAESKPTVLQMATAQSNVQQPSQQTPNAALENANPQATAGSQLAQASSKVQVQQAQANAPAANPQAATASLAPANPAFAALRASLTNALPAKVSTALRALQAANPSATPAAPAQSLATAVLEQAQPNAAGVGAQLAAAGSQQVIQQSTAQAAQAAPQKAALKPAEIRSASASSPAAKSTLARLTAQTEILKAALSTKLKVAQSGQSLAAAQLETTQAQSQANTALAGVPAAQVVAQAAVVRGNPDAVPAAAQIQVTGQATPSTKSAVSAKAQLNPTVVTNATLVASTTSRKGSRLALIANSPGLLETEQPTQAPRAAMAQANTGQLLNPAFAKSPEGSPLQAKPVLAVLGNPLKLLTSPSSANAARMVQDTRISNLADAKTSGAPTNQALAPGIQLEQPEATGGLNAPELPAAKSNRSEALAVDSTTKLGVPLTAANSVRPTAPPQLKTLTIPGAAKIDLPNAVLKLDGAADLVKLPDIKFEAGIKLETVPSVDNPMMLRDPNKRKEMIEELGGSEKTEKAIMTALDWFTRHQHPEGYWSIKPRTKSLTTSTASTGMAMLCYMGWGAKHNQPGPYQAPLNKAVQWLHKQTKENGDMRGSGGDMYAHGIAAIALAEAYSVSKDPKLRNAVIRMVDFTVRAQNPKTGGWRYNPYSRAYRDPGDMSVTGWQIMALKSARLAGVKVPELAFQRAKMFMDRVGGGPHRARYGYSGSAFNPSMTAEAMFCQQLMGLPPVHPRQIESAAAMVPSQLPTMNGQPNYYLWYYGTLALHQHQGMKWKLWNSAMRPILMKRQTQAGRDAGSWAPNGTWGGRAGRVITTAMATLSLEVYYRYLPMYNTATGK
ncbi:MAG: prenyltransferase/squalene oxidase repeat-containing protein, partial [Verrucomicrobiota bacterium]|nr:prenyltransferase/squalene oxidase repeat-containing protein [Verrucomicrobiota bacterium]